MPDLAAQLTSLSVKLAERARTEALLDDYFEGDLPMPAPVVRAKITNAYRMLMGMSTAPWGSLVVDSVQDRLEITGINSGNKAIDDQLWGWWQDNHLDAEMHLAHKSALISGRAYALVWPDPDTGAPEVSLDSSAQMVVRYVEGSRNRRESAFRCWTDEDTGLLYGTLYTPDAIYKFQSDGSALNGDVAWEQRFVDGEDWPVQNPFGVVPVVELPVNRRLKPGPWGHARGEFEHVTDLIDRISLLTFLGLVVAFWQGFPIRGVIGDRILRDDDGVAIPPFEVGADQIVQMENPQARLETFPAADRSNLSIYAELDQLATLTKTPAYYFPSSAGMSNISADTIRALEGTLVAKIPAHKASLGGGWLEVLRLAGLMMDRPVELPARASLQWADHASRSLAERADAATKLKDILPAAAIAEYVLNATQDDQARWQAMANQNAIAAMLKQAATQPALNQPQAGPQGQQNPQRQMLQAGQRMMSQVGNGALANGQSAPNG